jgi:GWxTD domain-containing protein
MKKFTVCLCLVSIVLLFACTLRNLEKNLDPESKEFYSKVRFIITRQERKVFLNLPPAERPDFIEEFWIKRDPDPETEVNEFQQQYFGRIEEADRLFKEGTTPGWTQDRGRVYITLGPPDHRAQYPRGTHFYGKPTEIWRYGFFVMIFVDDNWTGNYKLDPASAQHLAEINRAQSYSKPRVSLEKVVYDLDLKVRKGQAGEAVFRFEIPYRNIWFVEQGDKLETTIALSLRVLDQAEQDVWRLEKDYVISSTADEIKELFQEKYVIEVTAELDPGEYDVVADIENKTNGERVRKTAHFSL